jgi:hypothetical protein
MSESNGTVERTPADEAFRAVWLWKRFGEVARKLDEVHKERAHLLEEWSEMEDSLGRIVPGIKDCVEMLQCDRDTSYLVRVEQDTEGPNVTVRPLEPSYRLDWPKEAHPITADAVVDLEDAALPGIHGEVE